MCTSAGMSAGVDLALAIVESDFGLETSRMVARKLVLYQRRGGGQSQFSALLEMGARSDRVQMALTYASENLASDLSVERLAEAARLSPRQFSRVFREETGHRQGGRAAARGSGATDDGDNASSDRGGRARDRFR
ncbi:protein of unknown function (plasmid) [Caballeronia sp. S22]